MHTYTHICIHTRRQTYYARYRFARLRDSCSRCFFFPTGTPLGASAARVPQASEAAASEPGSYYHLVVLVLVLVLALAFVY